MGWTGVGNTAEHTSTSTKSAPRRNGAPGRGRPVRAYTRRASTKSAPRRSGDCWWCWRGWSARCSPQRSPLPEGAETVGPRRPAPPTGLNEVRSPKERRPSSAACSRPQPTSLNEVRSPKERRPLFVHDNVVLVNEPQRSPLPEGAETSGTSSVSSPRMPGLNEVRSPKERRHRHRVRHEDRRLPASTKSAPRRSGDRRAHRTQAAVGHRLNEVRSPKERRRGDAGHEHLVRRRGPQRSPLPEGAETHS